MAIAKHAAANMKKQSALPLYACWFVVGNEEMTNEMETTAFIGHYIGIVIVCVYQRRCSGALKNSRVLGKGGIWCLSTWGLGFRGLGFRVWGLGVGV